MIGRFAHGCPSGGRHELVTDSGIRPGAHLHDDLDRPVRVMGRDRVRVAPGCAGADAAGCGPTPRESATIELLERAASTEARESAAASAAATIHLQLHSGPTLTPTSHRHSILGGGLRRDYRRLDGQSESNIRLGGRIG